MAGVAVSSGQLMKRYTLCKIADHDWKKVGYPDSEGSAYFLRCLRCGKENHNAGGAVPGAHIF